MGMILSKMVRVMVTNQAIGHILLLCDTSSIKENHFPTVVKSD